MENTHFLPFLLLTLAALGLSYALGAMLLRLARVAETEPYFRQFLALTLGLTTLVSGYALWQTQGRSCLLVLPALAFVLLYWLRRTAGAAEPDRLPWHDAAAPAPSRQTWTPQLLLLGATLLLFAVRWGLLYDPGSEFLLTPFQDYIYYGRVSEMLNRTGLETRSLEQFYPQLLHVQPYHYFELWLNALLLRAYHTPGVWCLYLSAYTVLTTVVFSGLRALVAYFGGRGIWATGLVLLLILSSGVYWPPFEGHPFAEGGRYVATSLLLLEPKLSPIYIFLLLSALLGLRRQWKAFGAAIAVLPLVFITTLPAVLAILVILALWGRRRFSRGQLLGMLLPTAVVLFYLAAFYSWQQAPAQLPVIASTSLLKFPHPTQWRTLVNIFGGTLINIALYLGAFGLLGLVVGWGSFRAVARRWPLGLALLAGAFIVGILAENLAFTLTTQLPDSYQLLGNTLPPLFVVVLGGSLAALLSAGPHWRRTLTLAGLLALAWINHRRLFSHSHSMHKVTRFSPAFLRQVRTALPRTGNRGGFFMADVDYETVYHLTQDTFTRGTYVSNFLGDYAFASLAPPELKSLTTDPRFARDSTAAAACVRTSSFVRFVQLNALRGRHWPKDSAQYQFVVQQGLRFICLAPGVALPGPLQPLVQARYRDAWSGEEFVVLKPTIVSRPNPESL